MIQKLEQVPKIPLNIIPNYTSFQRKVQNKTVAIKGG